MAEYVVDYITDCIALNGFVAYGRVSRSYSSIKQSQVIVELGARPHGRPWVGAIDLLFYSNGWRNSLNRVYVWLV